MFVSILVTIIAFVAAVFIMKKQIDEENKKQDDKNKELLEKVKEDLGKSVQTKDNLARIANTVKNSLDFDKTITDISENDKQINIIKATFNSNNQYLGSIIKDNLDDISSIKSNLSTIETDVQTNLGKFRDVDRELSEVSNTVTLLGSNIDILTDKLSEDSVINSNVLLEISDKVNDIISSNNQLIGSNNMFSSNDLANLNSKIENISSVMSNLNIESISSNISLLDQQFETIANLNTLSSNNSQNFQDNREALNRFFDITSSDFVTQYKSANSGMGFKQWFDSSYNIGLNTTNFDNFESLIQKSDNLYTKVFETQENSMNDIRTDIQTIRQSLGNVSLDADQTGNIVNLQQIESILRSNANHINELKTNLNRALAEELSKIDGGVLASKFVGKNIELKDLLSTGVITAQDVSTNNLEITGNLNVDGKNIQQKLQEIENTLSNLSGDEETGGALGTNLTFTGDNELAEQLGIKTKDFVQQRAYNTLGSNITNIPQKFIHSVSANDKGAILFHEIDFVNKTSNIKAINPNVENISGSVLAEKINDDSEATFKNGIRLGTNGCLTLNEESGGKPRLDLCNKDCSTNCRKIWDYHYAPEPKKN